MSKLEPKPAHARVNSPTLAQRNLIAEIEKVIDAFASQSFSRAEFLKKHDRFYLALELELELLHSGLTKIIKFSTPPRRRRGVESAI